MVRVTPTGNQRLRLKMLHWDKMTRVGAGTVWSNIHEELPPSPSRALTFDAKELEALFGLMEHNMVPLRRLTSQQAKEIRFVEHFRAHNVAILLSGTHMSWEAFRCALMAVHLPSLGADKLRGLLKFGVPLPEEANAITLYLRGEHPAHPGLSDPSLLGLAESFYACVSLRVPRLAGRLRALAFIKSFRDAAEDAQALAELIVAPSQALRTSAPFGLLLRQVLMVGNHLNQGTPRGSAVGFKLESLLRLAEIKSSPGALEAVWASHANANNAHAAQPTHAGQASNAGGSSGGSSSSRSGSVSSRAHAGSSLGAGGAGGPPRTSLLQYVVCSALRGQQQHTNNNNNSSTSNISASGGDSARSDGNSGNSQSDRGSSSSNTSSSNSAAIAALPQQLAGVRAAAGIQVSGIHALVAELRGGYALLQAEAADLQRAGISSSRWRAEWCSTGVHAHSEWHWKGGSPAAETEEVERSLEAYLAVLEDFLADAEPTITHDLPRLEADLDSELRALCAYFGEEHDPKDPTRILCVVHRFLGDFARAVEVAQHEPPRDVHRACHQLRLVMRGVPS